MRFLVTIVGEIEAPRSRKLNEQILTKRTLYAFPCRTCEGVSQVTKRLWFQILGMAAESISRLRISWCPVAHAQELRE